MAVANRTGDFPRHRMSERGVRPDQWYQLCGEMRDRAGKLNAAVRAADKEGAERGMPGAERTSNACHAAFRWAK